MAGRLLLILLGLIAALNPLPADAALSKTASSPAQEMKATSPTLEGLPAEIPVGNAADDPETSRAILRILQACADAYASAPAVRMSGHYIEAAKTQRRGTAVEEDSASRLELIYMRPNHLRINVTGDEVQAGLVADGKTLTYLWPESKEYRTQPQPNTLAVFAEEERAGEILEDEANAVSYSIVASLLISEDPLRWLHANVKTYIYDGVEDVRGRPAWRIKFLQTDPEIVVVNWIDQETRLLSKVSIIQARDENGEFVESYQESAYGQIRIAVFDKFELNPESVSDKDFTDAVPRGWKVRKAESTKPPSRGKQLSGWEMLVRAAAAKTAESSTASLTAESGGDLLRMTEFIPQSEGVSALHATGFLDSESSSLLVGSQGKILCLRSDNSEAWQIQVTGEPGLLAVLPTGETTGPVIAAAAVYGSTVTGYTPDGSKAWSYLHRQSRISSLLSISAGGAGEEGGFYVGYLGGTGLRRLTQAGEVAFASRRLTGLTALTAGELPGDGWRVFASTGSGGGVYNRRGELVSKISAENEEIQIGLLAWDDRQPTAPLIQVAAVGEGEFVLRRARVDGSLVWTVPLAQGVEEAEPVGVSAANLRVGPGRELRRVFAALLSDGRLVVISDTGDSLWRGKAALGTSSTTNLQHSVTSLAVADRNRDGEDELYLGGEAGILQAGTSGAESR